MDVLNVLDVLLDILALLGAMDILGVLISVLAEFPTAIAGLMGAFVALTASLLTTLGNNAANRDRMRHERESAAQNRSQAFIERNIVDPVISYLETDLRVMSELNSNYLSLGADAAKTPGSTHVFDLRMAEARIRTIDDDELQALMNEYSRKRVQLVSAMTNSRSRSYDDVRTVLEDATYLASEVLRRLLRL